MNKHTLTMGDESPKLPPNIKLHPGTGRLSKCLKCHKVFYFNAEHKHHSIDDVEIIEAGTTCPHCDEWLHLGYLNEDLISRKAEIRNRRQERAFKRDYEKWQAEAREALGIEPFAGGCVACGGKLSLDGKTCAKCGNKWLSETGIKKVVAKPDKV